jgi:UDP-glucuronate 4-epimerase
MRALVTGAAGFIGSHLSERLLERGDEVVGLDCFTDYYSPALKRANVERLLGAGRFRLVEADLLAADLPALLRDVDVVFHQAGQPGTRLSWSDQFRTYVDRNILATQRLLEACRGSSIKRLVYASSSSVYGNSDTYPCRESTLPRPHSPYGVTKLAAEQLCDLYAANWGLPVVSLRYFTVYGPRQRPDMGIHIFLDAALRDVPVRVFGTGDQVRDFTYVKDVVEANIAAAEADAAGPSLFNISGGSSVSVAALLDLMGELVGHRVQVEHLAEQPGDVRRTGGSTERAEALLSWKPQTGLEDGLRAQLAWQRTLLTAGAAGAAGAAG